VSFEKYELFKLQMSPKNNYEPVSRFSPETRMPTGHTELSLLNGLNKADSYKIRVNSPDLNW
jgi:hypothetical protein